MNYKLTEQDRQSAQALIEAVTYPARLQHLQTWLTAPDSDKRKAREIAIARLATSRVI